MKRWRKTALAVLLGLGSIYLPFAANSDTKAEEITGALPFQDIAGSFAAAEITDLYQRGILEGTQPGIFSPRQQMTRAESLTAMFRLLGLKPSGDGVPAFRDTPKTAWYYGYIQAGAYLGLAQGKGSGKYLPSEGVTRQELAVWLIRFLKQTATPGKLDSVFGDAGSIADWAAPSVYTVQKLGLMEGANGRFNPGGIVTREEMAAIMDRIVTNGQWESQLSSAVPSRIQIGWQYGQTAAQFKSSVSSSLVNVIAPRWYFLNANGTMSNSTDTSLVSWAHSSGRKVWALAGNRSDPQATHSMLANGSLAKSAASSLAAYAKQYGLDGINLDFENVLAGDRQSLTAFVADLADKLHQNGAVLSVCVSPDLGTDWTAAFDYAALAKSADYVVLMGYDEHWSSDPSPGPVASLPWVTSALDKLLKVTPPEKTILGMPLYSRDWTLKANGSTSASEDVSIADQNSLVSRLGLSPVWNSAGGQYKTSYTQNGKTHSLWLEDARSLTLKYKLGQSRQLAGFAYWSIGGESSGIWQALWNASRFDSYKF